MSKFRQGWSSTFSRLKVRQTLFFCVGKFYFLSVSILIIPFFLGLNLESFDFFWIVETCAWTSILVKEMLVCPLPPRVESAIFFFSKLSKEIKLKEEDIFPIFCTLSFRKIFVWCITIMEHMIRAYTAGRKTEFGKLRVGVRSHYWTRLARWGFSNQKTDNALGF